MSIHMTPNKGQSVVLYLRYGVQIDGSVVKWEDEQVVLATSDGYAIIYNPSDDILATKLISKPITIEPAVANGKWDWNMASQDTNPSELEDVDTVVQDDYNTETPEEQREDIEEQIEETIAMPSANDLRVKKLATLRTMMQKADQAIITNKLNSHQASGGAVVRYEQPLSIFKRTE
jgi:hypothetical protein